MPFQSIAKMVKSANDGFQEQTSTSFRLVAQEDSTIVFTMRKEPDGNTYFEYKLNNEQAWNDWEQVYQKTTTLQLEAGDVLRLKGGKKLGQTSDFGFVIKITGSVIAYNSPASLVNNLASDQQLPDGAFLQLFEGSTGLVLHPSFTLPWTKLSPSCYTRMFYGCTGITLSPSLPATTLKEGCYKYMYHGCSSLKSNQALPASTLAENCYYGMFVNCSGITSCTMRLAVEMPAFCCKSMFYGCTGLTSFSTTGSATNLRRNCYAGMFYECTGLTSVARSLLNNVNLAEKCFSSMYARCTSLTVAYGPNATTYYYMSCASMYAKCTGLTQAQVYNVVNYPSDGKGGYCLSAMFSGCTALTRVYAGFTAWHGTYEWLFDASENATFYCPTALGTNETIIRGHSYCPESWTVVNQD